MLKFTKMNGAGNDFVLINNQSGDLTLTREQIAFLCDRHRGVGADGVLVLEAPQRTGQFYMRYYNSDGGEAEMCGNGARCFARFASREAGPFSTLSFETPAGLINAILHENEVTVGLSAPRQLVLQRTVSIDDRKLIIHSVNTGVPHAVTFVDNVAETPVVLWGRQIRHHAAFQPEGANANFVQITGPSNLEIRTYERGVEGETLACGTGVTAAALIYASLYNVPGPVFLQVRGGDWLTVEFTRRNGNFADVSLGGPATFSFEGIIETI